MRRQHLILARMRDACGLLSLAATLLLLSPGITIVQASETVPPASAVDNATPAAQPIAGPVAAPEAAIKAGPKAYDPAAEAAAGRPVVLNTRGYNYGPVRPGTHPAQIPMPTEPAPDGPQAK